jgi:hypothetical protein
MSIGYLSADTYNEVSPYKFYGDLKPCDYRHLSKKAILELASLSCNRDAMYFLFVQEYLDYMIEKGDLSFLDTFEQTLGCANKKIKDLVTLVGKIFFLSTYFSAEETQFMFLPKIGVDNYLEITEFRIKLRNALIKRITLLDVNESYNDSLNLEEFLSQYNLEDVVKEKTTYDELNDEDLDINDCIEANQNNQIEPNCCQEPSANYQEEKQYSNKRNLNSFSEKVKQFIRKLSEEEFLEFEDLFIKEVQKLPVRAFNVINYIGCKEFYTEYLFADEAKLLNLRNFGRKSFTESKQFILKLREFVTEAYNKKYNDNLYIEEPDIIAITDDIRLMLNVDLHELLKSKSVRARNAVSNYEGDFINDYVINNENILQLRNIGKKTEKELLEVCQTLSEKLTLYLNQSLTSDEVFIHLMKASYSDYIDEFSLNFYKENGNFPMFHILENIFRNSPDMKQLEILAECTEIYDDIVTSSITDVAKKYNITSEGIRSIRSRFIEKMALLDSKSLPIYSKFLSEDAWIYLNDTISGGAFIDKSLTQNIKEQECCSLAHGVILFIISILYKEQYDVLGVELLSVRTRRFHSWKNSYLVSKSLINSFRFEDIPLLLNEIESNLEEEEYKNIDELLLDTLFSAWISFDCEQKEDISSLLTTILIEDFDKIPNEEFKFTLLANKDITPGDIIYNVLSEVGNPLPSDELLRLVNEEFPRTYKSISSIVKNDHRFSYVGVDSLVGLIEWEHIKIGSIRDIIVQYLSEFDEPKELSEIVYYVQQYRDTSENSIRSTMQSGSQFISFKGGLFGLADKSYKSHYYITEFEEKINKLQDFIKAHGRFPFYSSSNSDEDALSKWWVRAKNDTTLNKEKMIFVKRINDEYKEIPTCKKEFVWFSALKEYKDFTSQNHRRPNNLSTNTLEKKLAKWFEKSQDDFATGNLTNLQVAKFIELCNYL